MIGLDQNEESVPMIELYRTLPNATFPEDAVFMNGLYQTVINKKIIGILKL